MFTTESNDGVGKVVIAVSALLVVLLIVASVYYSLFVFGIITTENEYVAELWCHQTENTEDPVVDFSELGQDKQQTVKRAIEEDALIEINASQKDYFEPLTSVKYQNNTYNCEVVKR